MKTLSIYTIISKKYKYNIEFILNSINNLKNNFNVKLHIITNDEDFFNDYINDDNIQVHYFNILYKIFKTCKYHIYMKHVLDDSDYICLCDSNVEINSLNTIDKDKLNFYENEKCVIGNYNNINKFLNDITVKINWDLVYWSVFNDKYYIDYYKSNNDNFINITDGIEIKENIKTLGIYYIATGCYNVGFKNFIKNINLFYPQFKKTIILLSDELSSYDNTIVNDCKIEYHKINNYPWPIITLFKMYYILKYRGEYDYICYCNADLEFNKNFNKYENIDLTRFTATKHNWIDDNFEALPLSNDNPKSSAYIGDHIYNYVNGGFFISEANIGYKMCEDVINMLNTDINNGVLPTWHDESYLNKWCFTNKDLAQTEKRILFPCFPKNDGPFYINYDTIKKPKYG